MFLALNFVPPPPGFLMHLSLLNVFTSVHSSLMKCFIQQIIIFGLCHSSSWNSAFSESCERNWGAHLVKRDINYLVTLNRFQLHSTEKCKGPPVAKSSHSSPEGCLLQTAFPTEQNACFIFCRKERERDPLYFLIRPIKALFSCFKEDSCLIPNTQTSLKQIVLSLKAEVIPSF